MIDFNLPKKRTNILFLVIYFTLIQEMINKETILNNIELKYIWREIGK